ncbi:MAG: DUF3429 domain-containing protein [Nitratireductor sp.]
MEQSENNSRTVMRSAWLLSLGGFLPFLLLALGLILTGKNGVWFSLFADGFKTWSAIILSFLGGIRWGMALRDEPVSLSRLAFSVLASIAGWISLFLPDGLCLMVLLLAYCAQGAWDSFSIHAGQAPAWFARLRITMTLLVAAAHALALVAVF